MCSSDLTMGLAMVSMLGGRSLIKALLAALFGLWLSSIGTDLFSATSRFTFGHMELLSGVDFVVVAIGVFAIGEVLVCVEQRDAGQLLPMPRGLRNLLPTAQDLKDCRFAFANGSVVGFLVGILPGAGSTIASFLSYGIEKAVSARKEQFGTGVIEGVAAPEGANNSETGGALVPLTGEGIDLSARLRLLGGKVEATVTRFETKQENLNASLVAEVRDELAPLLARPFRNLVDYRDRTSSGWEFQVLANLTRNWTLLAG